MIKNSARQFRSQLNDTPPVSHGALDYAELEQLGLRAEDILDFSVNSNPFGPSPTVQSALTSVPIERYPDREAWALRRTLASRLAVDPDQLVIGNGAAELLWLIALSFLRSPDQALVLGPTFGEYARLARLMGATVCEWVARADHNFAVDPLEVGAYLDQIRPQVTFLCNPNNPTGITLPLETIAAWVMAYPETLFVVDEAYLAFAPQARSALTLTAHNILVVRSMTKDYALAGLRLGYVVSHNRALIETLKMARPAWNVNALAQAAGVAALADETYYRQTLSQLAPAKQHLVKNLFTIGLTPLPSTTHFFLMPAENAVDFRRALLQQNVLVRDCASFGLPGYLRIATRQPAENERLVAAIQTIQVDQPLRPSGI